MAGIQSSPYFGANVGPDIKRGFGAIADMFAPPSGSDVAGYATARSNDAKAKLDNQKLSIIEKLRSDPRYQGADAGVLADLFDPTSSWAAQDQNTAADLQKNRLDNQTKAVVGLYGPLDQGQVRPAVPADVAGKIDMPAIIAAAGAPKPLSETEAKGQLIQQAPPLTGQQLTALAMSDAKTANIVGGDGKPEVVYTPQAVGREPAYAPNATITSDGFGQPPTDTAWARNPDGSVQLDERGVPVALPIKGTKTFTAQEDAARQATDKAAKTQTSGNIVLQDIDRALSAIAANPGLTTGMGAKLTSWWDGGPAANVRALTDSIRVNVGLDQLQAMRNSNPTGAGLGNVTERENGMLQAALGSLEQSQDDKQLTDNLARVKNIYADIVYGPGNGPPRERLSFPTQWDQFAAPVAPPSVEVPGNLPAGVTEDDIAFTMKKYGVSRAEVLKRLGVQ